MTGVAVTSQGLTVFGTHRGSLVDLLAGAGEEALEGVGRKPVDLLVVGTMAAGSFAGVENVVSRVADRLGLDTAAGVRVEAASASGAAAFHAGVTAVRSGSARRALVVAGETMTARSTTETSTILARSLAPGEQAVGATMVGLAALIAQRYLSVHDLRADALDAVSEQARACAAHNPNAQFRTAVSAAEVSASRPVALPLRLLHCSARSDGAAAVVVEAGEAPVQVRSLGQGLDAQTLADRADLTSFRATRTAVLRAFETARLTRKDIEFAELHDAFAPFALIDLEDIGMCGPGEGAAWFSKGWTRPDGRFPVNPSGGLLGRGHPVGASGLAQIVEVTRQLNGDAGAMAIAKRPRMGLAQSIGGIGTHNFVTVLERTDG